MVLGRREPGRILGAMGLAATVLLAGCTAAAPAQSTGLPDDVSVTFIQLRSDVEDRQAQVKVTNESDEPIVVSELTVRDGRFTTDAERVRDRDSTIPPGLAVDLRVQLPAMDCAVPDDGSSTLAITFRVEQEDRSLVVPLPEPIPFLAALHGRECLAETLADAASVTFTRFEPSSSGTPAALYLTVDPTGRGSARVAVIRETNLLTFDSAETVASGRYPLGIDVSASSAPQVTTLPLLPERCDPHAVLENKRGTVFFLEIEAQDASGTTRSGRIELAAPEDMKGRILTWVTEWCAARDGG